MSERPNYDEMTDEEIEAYLDYEYQRLEDNYRDRQAREEVEAAERLEHMRYETRNDGNGEKP